VVGCLGCLPQLAALLVSGPPKQRQVLNQAQQKHQEEVKRLMEEVDSIHLLGGGFKYFLFSPPIWGR